MTSTTTNRLRAQMSFTESYSTAPTSRSTSQGSRQDRRVADCVVTCRDSLKLSGIASTTTSGEKHGNERVRRNRGGVSVCGFTDGNAARSSGAQGASRGQGAVSQRYRVNAHDPPPGDCPASTVGIARPFGRDGMPGFLATSSTSGGSRSPVVQRRLTGSTWATARAGRSSIRSS